MKEQIEYLYPNYGFIQFPGGLGGSKGVFGAPRGPIYLRDRQGAPKYPPGPSQMYSKPKKMGQNPLVGSLYT